MKRFLILAAVCLIPALMSGQAHIVTKKMRLEDFPEKITKVVLSGNVFIDGAIKDEVRKRWRISPYEFCSVREFEALKGSADYYFLLTVSGQFRHEKAPELQFLSIVKGGDGADKGIEKMLEVVTVPFCSLEYPSGRELTFLPALLDIMQHHVVASMRKDIDAYSGLGNYSMNLSSADNMRVVISEGDIAEGLPQELADKMALTGVDVLKEEDADELMAANAPGTLVSFIVAPYDPSPGSYCYKMLIDSGSHTLYYFRKHRITPKAGAGFLTEDIKRIVGR